MNDSLHTLNQDNREYIQGIEDSIENMYRTSLQHGLVNAAKTIARNRLRQLKGYPLITHEDHDWIFKGNNSILSFNWYCDVLSINKETILEIIEILSDKYFKQYEKMG